MLMNDKIIFDRYYCLKSTKTQQKIGKCSRTLYFSLHILARVFIHMLDSGRGHVLMISRVDLKA